MGSALIDSMTKNYFKLFVENGDVDVDLMVKVLSISKTELAKLLNFTPDQLRQNRLGPVTKERLFQLATALERIAEVFDGDTTKALFWLNTPNRNFGGASARALVLRGKYNKVIQFIMSAE